MPPCPTTRRSHAPTPAPSCQVRGKLVASQGAGPEMGGAGADAHGFGRSGCHLSAAEKGHTLEFLREIAHLRPRSNLFGAVFRVRSRLAFAIHQFFQERGFVYVHTPIITASDCEGAGELFRVTTLDPRIRRGPTRATSTSRRISSRKKAYLTVSGQLEARDLRLRVVRTSTRLARRFARRIRNTSRHATEFWMIEPEMAFCDLHGDMDLAEEFVKSSDPRRARALRRATSSSSASSSTRSCSAPRLRGRAAVPAAQLHARRSRF